MPRRGDRLFLLSPEQGARTTMHVATSPALATVTGRYFKECKEAPANPNLPLP